MRIMGKIIDKAIEFKYLGISLKKISAIVCEQISCKDRDIV